MKHFVPIDEIRCGEFSMQLGFLSIDRVGSYQHPLAGAPKAEEDPRNDMPVLVFAWRRNAELVALTHQSLN